MEVVERGQHKASDLFWSANNLSGDKVADPPVLGSLLLEGIWSCFLSSTLHPDRLEEFQRGGGGGGVSNLFFFCQTEVRVSA